jgi:hypothetical protein
VARQDILVRKQKRRREGSWGFTIPMTRRPPTGPNLLSFHSLPRQSSWGPSIYYTGFLEAFRIQIIPDTKAVYKTQVCSHKLSTLFMKIGIWLI